MFVCGKLSLHVFIAHLIMATYHACSLAATQGLENNKVNM